MKRPFSLSIATLLLLLALCGCQTIGNWADSIGNHMPVIGERCEHWQCFTSSGQQISEQNKEKQTQVTSGSGTGPVPQSRQPISGNPVATPSAPVPAVATVPAPVPATAPPLSSHGASTPYDMSPEQLNNLPPAIPQN